MYITAIIVALIFGFFTGLFLAVLSLIFVSRNQYVNSLVDRIEKKENILTPQAKAYIVGLSDEEEQAKQALTSDKPIKIT